MEIAIETLIPFIDWTPFFKTWQLSGSFPKILKNPTVGDTAQQLFDDANGLLQDIIQNKTLTCKAVFGFFPAHSVGDDVHVLGAPLTQENTTFHFLRQQAVRSNGRANFCLSDFIAPKESEKTDYIGLFCVTAGLGIERQLEQYEAKHDTYNSILIKAIADRLVEAAAEYLHKQVRVDYWGYNPDEDLNNEALIREAYPGIRPAPGYPACPDHTEKLTLFELLDVENTIGVSLTESLAMLPASSISGYYFAHPEARYFGTGKIAKDQVTQYATRKNKPVSWVEKWLAPILNYPT